MSDSPDQWDVEADVVVLGTGGAGLTAALAAHDYGAAEVIVLEKSGMVGGTTAMSGGMLWIPLNPRQEEAGVADSLEDVVAYLDALAPGRLDPDTLEAFLEAGPQMVRFFDEQTPLRLGLFRDFPDYQPQLVGALPHGGRSLEPDVFPFEQLGSWATRVNPPKAGPPKLTSRMEDRRAPLDEQAVALRQQQDCRGEGQALIGSLLRGILDRAIPIHFEARARRLLRDGPQVVGVMAESGGRQVRYRARKSVIIATGGFEWNQQLVQAFLRGPMTAPVSVPENEGDGLLMAMEVGAALGNMSNAWWVMAAKESSAQGRGTHPNYLLCSSERARPGSILVNRTGRRFVNEAINYNALGQVLHNFDPDTYDYPNLPYWLIVDSRFTQRYRLFTSRAGQPAPPFAKAADSLEELAALIGVDGAVLTDTVSRFNAAVGRGHDDEFGRGDSTYDNFWGDQSFEPPHCTLGVIDQPPFYAVEVEAGVLGTCGGPKTDADARVLDLGGHPIEGLYAASNAMAGVTAGGYGGAGGTLGPGMTFGFIAGRHAAQKG